MKGVMNQQINNIHNLVILEYQKSYLIPLSFIIAYYNKKSVDSFPSLGHGELYERVFFIIQTCVSIWFQFAITIFFCVFNLCKRLISLCVHSLKKVHLSPIPKLPSPIFFVGSREQVLSFAFPL
jgi:hypothetical protein